MCIDHSLLCLPLLPTVSTMKPGKRPINTEQEGESLAFMHLPVELLPPSPSIRQCL